MKFRFLFLLAVLFFILTRFSYAHDCVEFKDASLLNSLNNKKSILKNLDSTEENIVFCDISHRFDLPSSTKVLVVGNSEKRHPYVGLIIFIQNDRDRMLSSVNTNKMDVPTIVKALKFKYHSFPDLIKEQKDFMYDVAKLTSFPWGIVTDHYSFETIYKKDIEGWMHGSEKNPDVLSMYWQSPNVLVDKSKNRWAMYYYVINYGGGVDSYEVYGKIIPFSIENIELKKVKPQGTFSFPLWG